MSSKDGTSTNSSVPRTELRTIDSKLDKASSIIEIDEKLITAEVEKLRILRSVKEGKAFLDPTLAKTEEGNTVLVLPNSLLQIDCKLVLLFKYVAVKLKAELRGYPSDELKLDGKLFIANDTFFSGMIADLALDKYYPTLTVKKTHLEDGKATSYFLRVREAACHDPKITASALKKNHYYFGNNPSEAKLKKDPVAYHLKAVLGSCTTTVRFAEKLTSLLTSIARQFPPRGSFESIFRHVLVSQVEVINMQTRSFKTSKVGRRKKTVEYESRLPKKIGVSPLLTTGEVTVIKSLTKSFYGEVSSGKPD